MACCGQQRESMRAQGSAAGAEGVAHAFVPRGREFEYTGGGELEVIGPLTGALYRFTGRGARQHVQSDDVASLLLVPNLRAV